MKLIGITQRVTIDPIHKERRDALDQRWSDFLHTCGYTPYPIPNKIECLSSILTLPFDGIIFSGGNTLRTDALERDQIETEILEYSISQKLPLLGVCRGMQLILNYFGSRLEKVQGHKAVSHIVSFQKQTIQVNSYHEYAAFEAPSCLSILGKAPDGVIESIKHKSLPIRGIMWHPEREFPFSNRDKKLFSELFKGARIVNI